jgi:hypothetical protein
MDRWTDGRTDGRTGGQIDFCRLHKSPGGTKVEVALMSFLAIDGTNVVFSYR